MKDKYPNKFTVKELIARLKTFPPSMRVITHGQKNGYENILNPMVISVYRDEEAMSEYDGEYDIEKKHGQDPIEVLLILRDNRWD